MKINLNPDTFTQITDGGRVLVQFRSGVADVAGSSDPAEGDWITFASGEKAYLEIESWGRGVGYAVLLEEGENPELPGGMTKPEISVVGDDIEVSFDPPGGSVTGYDVRYSTNETDWTVVSSVSSPYVIPDTDGATTYYVQV